MDSLLANYASSDEEDQPTASVQPKTTSFSSILSSLPQPKSSSSLFQSLPPPKQPSPATSSEILKPKSQIEEQQPKRVVQFKPPIIPLPNPTELDDDQEEEEERNRRRKLESSTQTSSVKSFLASIPAPKNTATLGVQASSGSGRRSTLETDAPAPAPASVLASASNSCDQSAGDCENYQYATEQYGSYYGNYSSGTEEEAAYEHSWGEGASGVSESMVKFAGKRGRHEVPAEVIEVKQEDLIKNRPREDQVKLTGIAFGPSHQPVSAKGKPSKLHKRKHQIGSLYFDMKQNEMKLAERRAKGMLTKAETQAKYGW